MFINIKYMWHHILKIILFNLSTQNSVLMMLFRIVATSWEFLKEFIKGLTNSFISK